MDQDTASLVQSFEDELNASGEVASNVLVRHVQHVNNLVFELL